MPHVIIRWAAFCSYIKREGWVSRCANFVAGNYVYGFAPSVVRSELEAPRKAARESCQQRVVACRPIRSWEEDTGSEEAIRIVRKDKPLIDQAHHLTACASLIAHVSG